jgi:hypothetical protein
VQVYQLPLACLQSLASVCCPAGQFNDAAYHLVQLRKILEDTSSSSDGSSSKGGMPLANAELVQLQEACTRCSRDLEEVRQQYLYANVCEEQYQDASEERKAVAGVTKCATSELSSASHAIEVHCFTALVLRILNA